MNYCRDEYVHYFNIRQPERSRKISSRLLMYFEKTENHDGQYNGFPNTLEKIRDFVSELSSDDYNKLLGIRKKSRDPSQYKNTRITIQRFPINSEIPNGWHFLADDLKNSVKYAWDDFKKYRDEDKKKNQFYFNPEQVLEDFLALDLNINYDKYKPFNKLSNNEKERIIIFLEKYGPYFIKYFDWEKDKKEMERYFDNFVAEYFYFKKAFEIIKEGKVKNFPYNEDSRRMFKVLVKMKGNYYSQSEMESSKEYIEWDKEYNKWQREIEDVQIFFLDRVSLKHKDKIKPPQQLYTAYPRGIFLLYDYLFENCSHLTQCQYNKCLKYFFSSRKNQGGCCPYHTTLIRKKRFRLNKK